jgi:antitoxin ParD1/3/4
MVNVILSPEQERFAREAVAEGRFRDMADVVQAGLELLRQAEAEAEAFVVSLREAQAEAEREGFISADDVHSDMARMLDEIDRSRA